MVTINNPKTQFSKTHSTNLNLSNLRVNDSMGLIIIASRSPWMALPPYIISWDSTTRFRNYYLGTHRQTERWFDSLLSCLEGRLKIYCYCLDFVNITLPTIHVVTAEKAKYTFWKSVTMMCCQNEKLVGHYPSSLTWWRRQTPVSETSCVSIKKWKMHNVQQVFILTKYPIAITWPVGWTRQVCCQLALPLTCTDPDNNTRFCIPCNIIICFTLKYWVYSYLPLYQHTSNVPTETQMRCVFEWCKQVALVV
jgi:hypothetical protein